MKNVNQPIEERNEMTLKELFHRLKNLILFLWSKWVVIFSVSLIFFVTGYIIAKTKLPTYKADLSFALDEEKTSGGGGLLGIAASFGIDIGGGGNLFTNQNILQLFSSKKIINGALLKPYYDNKQTHAEKMIDILKLEKIDTFKRPIFPIHSDLQALSRTQDSILNILYDVVYNKYFKATRPDIKVDIYHVIVETPDENFSSSFSRSIVEEVSKLYTQIKTSKSKQTVDLLQKRVDSLKGSYTRALYGQAAILDANINPSLRSVTVGANQKQAEMTTSAAAYQELLKNLEMAKYSLLKQSPLIQIIDEPRFPLEKKRASGFVYAIAGGFLGAFLIIIFLLVRRFLSTL